jgi:hypothetical protein
MPYTTEQINENYMNMFGHDIAGMNQMLESNIHGPHGVTTYNMLAMQILSDAQHVMEYGSVEDTNKLINKSKWVLGIIQVMAMDGKTKWTLEEAQKEA